MCLQVIVLLCVVLALSGCGKTHVHVKDFVAVIEDAEREDENYNGHDSSNDENYNDCDSSNDNGQGEERVVPMNIYDRPWRSMRNTREFGELEQRVHNTFGYGFPDVGVGIPIAWIPDEETFGGLKAVVEQAIYEGHIDSLLAAYNVTPATWWARSRRMQNLSERFEEVFFRQSIVDFFLNDMDPVNITMDDLERLIEKSLAENHNYWNDFVRFPRLPWDA